MILSAQLRRSLVEDMSYSHHPIIARVREIVHNNQLGAIRSIHVEVRWPIYYYTKVPLLQKDVCIQ